MTGQVSYVKRGPVQRTVHGIVPQYSRQCGSRKTPACKMERGLEGLECVLVAGCWLLEIERGTHNTTGSLKGNVATVPLY